MDFLRKSVLFYGKIRIQKQYQTIDANTAKKQVYILLVIIIIIIIMLQILNVTISFELMKEGFHSDEMWSYGFANSFYEPLIYENDDGSPAMGVWRDGSDFGDYITVQKGEQFRPDSAWYNEKIDRV